MSLDAQKLTWNAKTNYTEEKMTNATASMEVDGSEDANFLLVTRDTANKPYSGSIKAGDFWMSGQGSFDFEVTQSHTYPYVMGPFESGRFMQSDSTFTLSLSSNVTTSDVVASLLEVPK